jgi:acyl-CoA synthetase (AMP-forming)/AMP-acid ligase II
MNELLEYIKTKNIRNFGEILEYYEKKSPDKVFLTDLGSSRQFTYSEFNLIVDKTAEYLWKQSLPKESVVSIVVENSWIFLCFYFASLKLGLIINPFPFSLEAQDLKRYFDYINPAIVIAGSDIYQDLSRSSCQHPLIEVKDEQWFEILKGLKPYDNFSGVDVDKTACLYYSSGTTASPKGIMVSHRNMLSNISSIVDGFNFDKNEKHLVFLPLGHTASINYSILPCLFVGGEIILTQSIWNLRVNFWETVSQHCITFFEMVPTALFIILNMPKPSKKLNISSLKWAGCGSSQLLVQHQVEFSNKFNIPVGNLYGLSETGPSHIDYPLSPDWEPGSIGRALSVNNCKIVDKNGKECRVNIGGEILLKGDNIFVGYYKNRQLYNESIVDGYFHTGDLGYKANDGRFYFLGRRKDLIIKGGVNILPAEIEEILSKHHNVAEVAVIGIPNKIYGEEVCAILRLKAKIRKSDLLDFCAKEISHYKIPKEIIFTDDFPKGPSGKVLKRVLRDKYCNGDFL